MGYIDVNTRTKEILESARFLKLTTVSRFTIELFRNTQPWQFGIFGLLKLEKKMNREISHFNYNSKLYDKCKSALKPIKLFTIYFH